jgi:hypothetical protein
LAGIPRHFCLAVSALSHLRAASDKPQFLIATHIATVPASTV